MAGPTDCVFLTCFEAEFSTLAAIVQYSGIRARRAETVEEADFYLTVTGARALVTDVVFLDGDWRDALRLTARYPITAALIAAEEADWPFLAGAYAAGACGVLWKPLNFRRLVASIRTLDQAARDREQWLADRAWSGPASTTVRRG